MKKTAAYARSSGFLSSALLHRSGKMRKIQVVFHKKIQREVEKAYVFQLQNLPDPVRRRFALSTSAIFVKLADAPSGVTAFYRLFLAALALLPFLLFRKEARAEVRGLSGGQWRKIIAAGLFLALHYVMWFESLRFTSIASSTVLVCLQPLFSLALERVILKSKLKPTAICGCAIALVGSVIIGFGDFQVSGMSLLGDVLAFLAAGSSPATSSSAKPSGRRSPPSPTPS